MPFHAGPRFEIKRVERERTIARSWVQPAYTAIEFAMVYAVNGEAVDAVRFASLHAQFMGLYDRTLRVTCEDGEHATLEERGEVTVRGVSDAGKVLALRL